MMIMQRNKLLLFGSDRVPLVLPATTRLYKRFTVLATVYFILIYLTLYRVYLPSSSSSPSEPWPLSIPFTQSTGRLYSAWKIHVISPCGPSPRNGTLADISWSRLDIHRRCYCTHIFNPAVTRHRGLCRSGQRPQVTCHTQVC